MTVHWMKDEEGETYCVANCDECGEGYDPEPKVRTPRDLAIELASQGWICESRIEVFHGESKPYYFDRCSKCVRGIWP